MENNIKPQPIDLHTIPELQKITVREGFTLRPLIESDASRILEILSADETIRKRVTVASRMHTVEDVATEVEAYKNDSSLIRYTITEQDNPVGLVSLWRDNGFFGTPPNPDDYGFGYFLDPAKRGKGLVTGSIKKLMETLQAHIPVRQFVAFCESDNTESIAVLTKLGFQPTGEIFDEPNNGWREEKYVRLPQA